MLHATGCLSLTPFEDQRIENEEPSIPFTTATSSGTTANATTTATATTTTITTPERSRGTWKKETKSSLKRKKVREAGRSPAELMGSAQSKRGASGGKKSQRTFKGLFGDRHEYSTPAINTLSSSSTSSRKSQATRTGHSNMFSGSKKTHPNSNSNSSTKTGIHSTREHETRPLIQPRLPNLFTPSLPAELWLLILKYASSPPFPPPSLPISTHPHSSTSSPTSPSSTRPSPAYTKPYPYPTHYDPTPTPISFLSSPTPHTHREQRLAEHKRQMRAKAALTRVCRAWNEIGQEVLWEFVWIEGGRMGRGVAERLCGGAFGGGSGEGSVVSVGHKEEEKGKSVFAWMGIGRKSQTEKSTQNQNANQTTTIVHRKSSSHFHPPPSVGRFIRRLHVETRTLDRCSPHDLLLILQHCPRLEEYGDWKSVRRPMHPLTLSLSDVVPFSAAVGSSSSSYTSKQGQSQAQAHHQTTVLAPDALLHALLSRPLKRLTYTNYDYDPSNYLSGVEYYEQVVAPRLEVVGGGLEYLELGLSLGAVFGMGGREGWGWGVGRRAGAGEESDGVGRVASEGEVRRGRGEGEGGSEADNGPPMMCKNPAVGMYGAANMLTDLEASFTKTTLTISSSTPTSSSTLDLQPSSSTTLDLYSTTTTTTTPDLQPSIDGFIYTLHLPSLTSLKATLDNATFHVLSTWDMPALTHLAVVAADFSYAGKGFRRFFEVHGVKVVQLELGHCERDIEEAWVTEPPPPASLGQGQGHGHANGHGQVNGNGPPVDPMEGFRIPLDAWCPALKEFICSADAEWNWRSPDWIAPHVLLTTHSGVEFIGIRGMEKRVVEDLEGALRRRMGDRSRRRRGWGGGWDDGSDAEGEVDSDEEDLEDDPYFVLLQQFSSFLRAEAFPSLRFVRDMSWESDIMRRTGRMSPLPPSAMALASMASMSPPKPIPLEKANSSAIFTQQSLSSLSSTSLGWWARTATSSGGTGKKTKTSAKESAVKLAERHLEEALVKSYGRRLNGFWREVQGMCHARGVWLEDCRGVNVTAADLRRAVMW